MKSLLSLEFSDTVASAAVFMLSRVVARGKDREQDTLVASERAEPRSAHTSAKVRWPGVREMWGVAGANDVLTLRIGSVLAHPHRLCACDGARTVADGASSIT